MARDFARAFYKSSAWEIARGLALMRDHYLCRVCGRPADEVHHKIHLSPDNIQDPRVSLCQDNLISLCHNCHSQAHHDSMTDEGFSFDENGNLVKI